VVDILAADTWDDVVVRMEGVDDISLHFEEGFQMVAYPLPCGVLVLQC